MFGINIHTKQDPLSAAFWIAVAQQVATAVILTLIASIFIKKPRASVPDLEAASRMVLQPNMPRQNGYGDFWVTPKIIDSGNPRGLYAKHGKSSEGHGGNFRGYSLLLAFTDHPIWVRRFQIDGSDFLSELEMLRLNRNFVVTCHSNNIPPRRINNVPGGIFINPDPTVRQEANKRVRDSHRNSDPCMQIIPKLRGYMEFGEFFDPRDITQKVMRFNYTGSNARWEEHSSALVPRIVSTRYTDSQYYSHVSIPHHAVIANSGQNFIEGNNTWFQYSYWGSGVQASQHCYGTSTMYLSLPIGYRKDESAIWPSLPQVKVLAERGKDTLKLWDPRVKGNPEIDTAWTRKNPALCICDYLHRYTRFQYPVCGYSRIDYHSIARAARICHEKGYEANGMWTQANTPFEVLQQLALAMNAGYFVVEGGIISVHAGERGNPVYGYDKDEIVVSSVGWSTVPRENRKAMIDVAYIDGASGTRQNIASENPDSKDALQITQTQFIFINNARQAAKVAFILNSRAWETEVLEFELEPGVPVANVNDLVTVDLEQYAGIKGTFRVMSVEEKTETGVVTMQVASERPDLYSADPDVLLSQNNYLPPAEPDLSLQSTGWIVGLNADGSYIYAYVDDDTYIQLNQKSLANESPVS